MNAADWARGARLDESARRRMTERPRNARPRRKPLDPARRAAFDVLRAVSERDAYANLALPALLRERGITGPRRGVRHRTHLRHLPHPRPARRDHRTLPPVDRPSRSTPCCWICCGWAPTSCCAPGLNTHAAVSTTVEQAGIEFDSARAGFVNGVLRTIAGRDEQSWVEELAPPADSDPVGHAAFVHAHPRWIAQAFADALGADAGQLDALLASDDERPSVHLAARPGVLTADELAAQVDGTVGRYSPYAVYLPGGDPGRLEAVREGAALVQDEGSQLVARALTLAERGRPRHRPMARPVRRPGRQDGAAGRAADGTNRRRAGHCGRARRQARRPGRAEHPRPSR